MILRAFKDVLIGFKTQQVLAEFESKNMDARVVGIVKDVALRLREEYGMLVVVTCALSGEGEHREGRAIDIRCKYFTLEVAVMGLQNYILDKYPRNDRLTTSYGKVREYKSCHIHGKGSNIHAHISVDRI